LILKRILLSAAKPMQYFFFSLTLTHLLKPIHSPIGLFPSSVQTPTALNLPLINPGSATHKGFTDELSIK